MDMYLSEIKISYLIILSSETSTDTGEQATLDNMLGVFYILLAGLFIGIGILLCECGVAIYRDKQYLIRTQVDHICCYYLRITNIIPDPYLNIF